MSPHGVRNMSTSTEPTSGEMLGRYELLLPIAKGGMAQVWAAQLRGSRGFQKTVAIKTILKGSIDDARLEQMFLAEAEVAANIRHPNVVETFELGEHAGTLYLVMEWVDGEAVSVIQSIAHGRGGIPIPVAVNMIGQACKGLHAAHELCDDIGNQLGLVHRDISPQNLLVTHTGTTKIVDFGIAKATQCASTLTELGEVKGKVAYMSPEQVRGQAIDRRSDIFSMGIMLYYLTSGRHPFKSSNPAQTISNICSSKPPPPPNASNPSYPPELESVIMKALRKDPKERWESAHAMLGALEQACPEALEGSFEVKVGEFVSNLLSDRLSDRRSAIRIAREHAERSRIERSIAETSNVRSISAAPINRDEQHPEAEAAPSSFEATNSAMTSGISKLRVQRLRRVAFVSASAFLVVGTAVAAAFVVPNWRSSTTAEPKLVGTMATPVVQTSPAKAVSTKEAASVSPSSSSVSNDAPAVSEEASTTEKAEKPTVTKRKSRRRRRAVRRAAVPRTKPQKEPVVASATASVAHEAAAPQADSAAPPPVNEWSKDFGGRR